MSTLIILNPHAGAGRAGKLWSQIEPLLWQELGSLVIAVTQHPEEVAQHLERARDSGLHRVIAIGGDGTNNALINELIRLNQRYPAEPLMTFGSIPVGTGQDWARTIGLPLKPREAVDWIKSAHPAPLDAGRLTMAGQDPRHFLNIASAGIGGLIAERVNRQTRRYPWSFHLTTLQGLLAFHPPQVKVKLDGKPWYEGTSFAVVVANGQSFGHGMRVAPHAVVDDGLFDVVLIEGMPRLEAAMALNTIYSGAHLKRSDVHSARAQTVEVEGITGPLMLELDGETAQGNQLRFEVLKGALSTLVSGSASSN